MKEKQEERYWVYAVLNPETLVPVYIGITKHPRDRYHQHQTVALKGEEHSIGFAPFHNWLRSQLRRGIEPPFRILGYEPTEKQALRLEALLISAFRPILLNVVLGSDGFEGSDYRQIDPSYYSPHSTQYWHFTPITPDPPHLIPVCEGAVVVYDGNKHVIETIRSDGRLLIRPIPKGRSFIVDAETVQQC